ncbi:hypothetical protein D8B26_007782 [Coccidioides posadasii str. Silveira]|uniref:uncharacterized protein n=1 Tax=Coccidioides posadasii (strain RMSCC 757 / Silveira) TaxID=443226 RepID=UPI001BF0F223|nr:hypothetical protein D8B26_007782 [Coccidioides posadasii str. Silveira]
MISVASWVLEGYSFGTGHTPERCMSSHKCAPMVIIIPTTPWEKALQAYLFYPDSLISTPPRQDDSCVTSVMRRKFLRCHIVFLFPNLFPQFPSKPKSLLL